MTNYSSSEMMIVAASRLLRDGDVVFVGIGQPNLACNLARRTHAPNLNMIYEAGVIGAQLRTSLPDAALANGVLSSALLYDDTCLALRGHATSTLLPVILALAAGVALAGSLVPLRRAARFEPAPILRGE